MHNGHASGAAVVSYKAVVSAFAAIHAGANNNQGIIAQGYVVRQRGGLHAQGGNSLGQGGYVCAIAQGGRGGGGFGGFVCHFNTCLC